jgi:hypothetical protein
VARGCRVRRSRSGRSEPEPLGDATLIEHLDGAGEKNPGFGSRQNRAVQFSPDLRARVADGTITVSYRLWSRPKVKVGGVYRSGSVAIEIDDIELVPFSSITDEDLARTGENDVEALRRRAAHAGPIGHDTLLYRVEFHVARQPDDDR